MRGILILVAGCVFCLIPGMAQAYIGPGLGAGAVALIAGFLASIGLALMAIFWYPIKRLFSKKGKPEDKDEE